MSPGPVWRRRRLLTISWADMGRMCMGLAVAVRESGFVPDTVVGITRGGLTPAVALTHQLAVPDFRILGIPRNTSEARYSERGAAVLDYVAPRAPLTGAAVLVVDDITGDGGTMEVAAATVRELGAADVRTAVLIRNVGSVFHPDFHAAEVDDWTVFPWERVPGADETAVPLTEAG